MVEKQKFLSTVKLLQEIGGVLCGSRNLNTSWINSDWDIFFIDEEVFKAAILIAEKTSSLSCNIYKTEERWVETGTTRYSSRERKQFQVLEGCWNLDLILVDEIKTKEEQLLLHLEKYPEKIANQSLPDGWEEWVFQKKLARKLSGEQTTKYILWLSDSGKL